MRENEKFTFNNIMQFPTTIYRSCYGTVTQHTMNSLDQLIYCRFQYILFASEQQEEKLGTPDHLAF